MAAATIPMFSGYLRSATVRAGALELHVALNRARHLAIARRQSICVRTIAAPANGYQFRPGGCGNPALILPGAGPAGTFSLQNNVAVTNAGPSIVFTTLGAAVPAGRLTVTGPGGITQTVTVSASGRIKTP